MATERQDWGGPDYEEDEHAKWLERWTSACPDGRPQRVARCLGYREREPRRLQLRVALGGSDGGVCDVIVEEHEETVRVRLLVCYDEADFIPYKDREYMNCPVHVYLEQPLGERTVVDVETDQPVPLFVSEWG
jgi:hypothetical protein